MIYFLVKEPRAVDMDTGIFIMVDSTIFLVVDVPLEPLSGIGQRLSLIGSGLQLKSAQ